MTIIDRHTKTILQFVDFKQWLKNIYHILMQDNVLRINVIPKDEFDRMTQSYNPGALFCQCIDQYSNKIGHPFTTIIEKTWPIEKVREYLINKLKSFNI